MVKGKCNSYKYFLLKMDAEEKATDAETKKLSARISGELFM